MPDKLCLLHLYSSYLMTDFLSLETLSILVIFGSFLVTQSFGIDRQKRESIIRPESDKNKRKFPATVCKYFPYIFFSIPPTSFVLNCLHKKKQSADFLLIPVFL